MQREFSAGGVVVRKMRGRWHLAAIRPAGKKVWALPKGLIGRGESASETAVREVAEETGVDGKLVEKLGDVRYVYTWKGQRIFKVVSFFLLRYTHGRVGEIPPQQRREVDEARWFPLEEAPGVLAYTGERDMAQRALQILNRQAL